GRSRALNRPANLPRQGNADLSLFLTPEMANDQEGCERSAGDRHTDTDQRTWSPSGWTAAEWITALSKCRIPIDKPCSGYSAHDSRTRCNTKNRTHEASQTR